MKALPWKIRVRNDGSKDEMTWWADTPLGRFIVYTPFAWQWKRFFVKLPISYHPRTAAMDDLMGVPKHKVKSMDDGKAFCQKAWESKMRDFV